MDPFIAQIMLFGGNFAPRGWAFCNGQLLPISQNTALFSLIGTIYGGNGQTTFALPDLRGRVAIHPGQGPGLSNYSVGQRFGVETNTLTINNLPPHNHSPRLRAESAAGTSGNPTGNLLGVVTADPRPYAPPVPADEVDMSADSIVSQTIGGGQPVTNIQPYLAVNYIIALVGIFPSRN